MLLGLRMAVHNKLFNSRACTFCSILKARPMAPQHRLEKKINTRKHSVKVVLGFLPYLLFVIPSKDSFKLGEWVLFDGGILSRDYIYI